MNVSRQNARLRDTCEPLAGRGALGAVPREPLEPLEPSAPPSPPGRLCGDADDPSGIRDETATCLKVLGIDGPLFESFPCVLPEHDHPAKLHFNSRGFWQYRCPGLTQSVGLGEVCAFLAYGRPRHLSNLEAARWHERLSREAGLRFEVPLDVRLPEPCPDAARIVADRMRLLVGLRDACFPLTEPFPFASDFAQAYCDLSADEVRGAKSWLERAGVVYRVGEPAPRRRPILWKLAAQDEIQPSRHQGEGR